MTLEKMSQLSMDLQQATAQLRANMWETHERLTSDEMSSEDEQLDVVAHMAEQGKDLRTLREANRVLCRMLRDAERAAFTR